MCLNSGGVKWQRTKIFFKKFLEGGGKWQRGENDRGYYGNQDVIKTPFITSSIETKRIFRNFDKANSIKIFKNESC